MCNLLVLLRIILYSASVGLVAQDSSGVRLLSRITSENWDRVTDVKAYGDYAFVATGNLAILDISDPTSPQIV